MDVEGKCSTMHLLIVFDYWLSQSESYLFFSLCFLFFLLSSESRECLFSRLSCLSRFFSSCLLLFLLDSSSNCVSSFLADVVPTGMFAFSTGSDFSTGTDFKLGGKLDSSEGPDVPLQTGSIKNELWSYRL